MKLAQIESIQSIHTAFSKACVVVKKAQDRGEISASRASANDKSAKVSTVTIADTSKMTPAELLELKGAVKLYNAGHALQTAYGCKLAHIGDLAVFAKQHVEPENVVEMPAAPQPATTSEAPAAEGKAAKKAKSA